ncbi:MAG: glycosyltransferase family 4 protein [Nanopusillaceae archaeon]
MRKLNLLSLNVMYPPDFGGGAEVVMHDLNILLAERGYDVHSIVFHTEEKPKFDIVEGINVWRFRIPNIYFPHVNKKRAKLLKIIWHLFNIYNVASCKILKNFLSNFKPDLIIMHNTYGWSPSILFSINKYNIPTIQVLHDLHYICYRSMFKGFENCNNQCFFCKVIKYPYKKGSNYISAVVGVSKFVLEKHLEFGYFQNVKFKKVIYNRRKIEIKPNLNIKENNNIISIGYIGSIAPNKGIEVLLKAFKNFSNNKNIFLYIAGSGDHNYMRYLQDQYNNNHIIWLGYVKAESFYPQIDFIVVPSIWYENFPTVVIEANYFGKPVIASKIGGIPEIVKPKLNGDLFAPGNTGELTIKILEFINNINYWREKAEDIHNYCRPFFDTKRWGDEWEELIQLVLKESN